MKPPGPNKTKRFALGSIIGAVSLTFTGAGAVTAAPATAGDSGLSAVVMTENVNDWG